MRNIIKNPNFPNPALVVLAEIDKNILIRNNTVSYKELNAS